MPTAFILWGGNAKAKAPLITNPIHAVFKAAHPSPLSAYNGFSDAGIFLRLTISL